MPNEPSDNGRPRVRRLALVEDPAERPVSREGAVRRYRLARLERLERVAEASPVERPARDEAEPEDPSGR